MIVAGVGVSSVVSNSVFGADSVAVALVSGGVVDVDVDVDVGEGEGGGSEVSDAALQADKIRESTPTDTAATLILISLLSFGVADSPDFDEVNERGLEC
ncbi:hypothetical protein ACIQYZ_34045 [Rhodococcus erythropolis]|jgi:hypothetical protein